MLTIRMQRTGRSGHAQFRVVVQDSHFHPTRGRVVAYVGSYDPHAKTSTLDKETITKYLGHGAQPSDRVVKLLKKEGVDLPAWVKTYTAKERTIKNPDKLRRNRPAGAPEPVKEEAAEEPTAEVDTPSETPAETETPAKEAVAEAPAEPEAPAEEAAEPEAPAEIPAEKPAKEAPAAEQPEEPKA